MPNPDFVEELRAIGLAAGLDRVGFATAEPFEETRVVLEARKADGLHGGMQFTYRNPSRSTDPARSLPDVRTLVVAARAYPSTMVEPDPHLVARGPLARVARYATDDHYRVLRVGLEAMAERLRADGWSARVVLDDNALVDRAAAHRAGIGWFGKNANILIDGIGSWFVLGSVLTNAPLHPAHESSPEFSQNSSLIPMADGCGGCTRCLSGCPTGAIIEPGIVDARRCLAWLVQAEGVFPRRYREALGDRIYGCDVCQEVCPPSIRTTRNESSDPTAATVAPVSLFPGPSASGSWVAVLDLLQASDEDLLSAYGRWYIPKRDPRYLRRNALVVLGNSADLPVAAEVREIVAAYSAGPDQLLRAHAVWAARRLGLSDVTALVAATIESVDPLATNSDFDVVRSELAAEVPERAGSSPS